MIVCDQDLRGIQGAIARSGCVPPGDDHRLIADHIERNPHRPWVEDARLVGSGVPVWALVAYLPAVDYQLSLVARDYAIPLEAVIAAILYYVQHRTAIDERIAANDDPAALAG